MIGISCRYKNLKKKNNIKSIDSQLAGCQSINEDSGNQ
jgi:hypothetical protein